MPTIARSRALPVLPTRLACPAAAPIEGVTPFRSGVVCRVIQLDRQREAGLDMTPGQLQIARSGGDGDVFLSIEKDPQSVEQLCCGDAVPVIGPSEVPGNRASYTYCPVWQAEKERIEEGRDVLGKPVEQEELRTSHYDDGRGGTRAAPAGSSYDSADPWAQARADLDLLAPQGG